MLAHAIEEPDFAALDPARLHGRMEMGRHPRAGGGRARATASASTRLYSRTGEDISGAFPISSRRSTSTARSTANCWSCARAACSRFNVLQQRLNRKTVTPKLIAEFPAHLRAYDLLVEGDEDLRELPFAERRARLEAFIARLDTLAHRPLAAGAVRNLGRARRGARRSGRRRRRRGCRGGRRRDAQAARRALCAGPAERPVVEMEARSVHRSTRC